MTREIKFRAWDKLNLFMYKNEFVSTFDFESKCAWVKAKGKGGRWLNFKNADTMQFTGSVDKKGVDIYEGDIIEGHTFDELIEKKQIGLIEYNEGRHGFVFVPNAMKSKNLYYPLFAVVTCEVIGNIYENPELLEEQS